MTKLKVAFFSEKFNFSSLSLTIAKDSKERGNAECPAVIFISWLNSSEFRFGFDA